MGNHKDMAVVVDTFSEALEVFNGRYQSALANNSKREIERFKSITNQINSYYDIVGAATGENATTRAQDALDAIVALLNAESITISDPVTPPLGVGILISPNNILIPTDADGLNPVYTNAFSDLQITLGATLDTSNWAFAVQTQTNVTATITTPVNRVVISAITADEGSVVVRCTKTGYSDIDVTIPVKKSKQGASGTGGVTQDGTTLSLRATDEGTVAGNVRGNNSTDLQTERALATQVANGQNSVICGGERNSAINTHTVAVGGYFNESSGDYSVMVGGNTNAARNNYSVIVGGLNNQANASWSYVGGGQNNVVNSTSPTGTIVAGRDNTMSFAGFSGIFGSYNTCNTEFSFLIGIGGTSSTLGQYTLSLSDSAVQKNIYFLEGETSSTSLTPLQTIKRSSFGNPPENINIPNETAYYGFIDLCGYRSDGEVVRRKYVFNCYCDNAGSVTVTQNTILAGYTFVSGAIDGTLSINVATNNTIIVNITSADSSSINWVAAVEVFQTDI